MELYVPAYVDVCNDSDPCLNLRHKACLQQLLSSLRCATIVCATFSKVHRARAMIKIIACM